MPCNYTGKQLKAYYASKKWKKKLKKTKKKKGWKAESTRHSLARKGVKTGERRKKKRIAFKRLNAFFKKGWASESLRHSLARKGVKTKKKLTLNPLAQPKIGDKVRIAGSAFHRKDCGNPSGIPLWKTFTVVAVGEKDEMGWYKVTVKDSKGKLFVWDNIDALVFEKRA
jgi:hypothetical protein